jgi:hypothetical protein
VQVDEDLLHRRAPDVAADVRADCPRDQVELLQAFSGREQRRRCAIDPALERGLDVLFAEEVLSHSDTNRFVVSRSGNSSD